ncbi:MAG: HIT domain-containing protein [Eubacteriales bacterium]|nr:HIT domain-containing protein [Eubacteriales bacterium]
MKDCIFCKIVSGEIPSKKYYEDDYCFAFADLNPQMPFHALIVPKEHAASLAELDNLSDAALAACLRAAQKIAEQNNITDGYRFISNCGKHASQSVQHLHFHMLAGRQLSEKIV